MPDQMTSKERVKAALSGGDVDRPPAGMWRHFYHQETSADGLAEAMLSFQKKFGWDFMKVNPAADFQVEDWGVRTEYTSNPNQAPTATDWPVKEPSDWHMIIDLNVHNGTLGWHLEALETISRELGGKIPFLMTVFTPLSVAGRLAGDDEAMKRFMKERPDQVHAALEAITDTFIAFSTESLNRGASGLYYATTHWATYDALTDEEYNEFGRPYDLKLLQALPPAEFNVLHVCRSNNMLSALKDYPVNAFSWDARDPTNPSLKEGKEITGKTVIGGIAHKSTLLNGKPEDVAAEVKKARSDLGGKGWMVGPGCTYAPYVPEENLNAIKQALSA